MKNLPVAAALLLCFTLHGLAQSPRQQFQAVPLTDVHFGDSFWGTRLEINKEITLPHLYRQCEETGRFANFAKVAGLMEGTFRGIYYNDSDVYKLLEGIAYSLAQNPDPEWEEKADAVIAGIAAAQQPNGYLNSYFTLREPDNKWTRQYMHELYCAGHLIEAAIAWKQATGKDTLLDVAEKFVEHIIDVFITEPSARFSVPGHPQIELALVKLSQQTGEEKYLTLARHFIDRRGNPSGRSDRISGTHEQDHLPVRQQFEAVGHAVRAGYLYAGMTDIAAHSPNQDRELELALDHLWNDVVNRKMYITGGIGSRHSGEAFGMAYELPNRSAYCETCAAIGLVFWAHRMNLLHGNAQYADVVERVLYNGVLSGIGRDGMSFFYVNPLESAGSHHRKPFFSTACCPTNIARFLPSLPGYQYAVEGNTIYVNQYIAGTATIQLPEGKVTITQETNYPWDGKVMCFITNEPNAGGGTGTFKVVLRQPGWRQRDTSTAGGYGGSISGGWDVSAGNPIIKSTKTLGTDFGMEARRMIAHPNVVTNRGRVAIQRGPLVYCFEQRDNDVPVAEIRLARDPEFKEEFKPDVLGGIVVIKCKNADGRELTAIPYYAWNHREPGAMAVWVRQEGLSRMEPPQTRNDSLYAVLIPDMLRTDGELAAEPELGEFAVGIVPQVTASHCNPSDALGAVIDGVEPRNSNDHNIPRMTFWDHRGTAEWVELNFEQAVMLSQTSVYWFDDTGRGACRIPKSWTLSYRKEDEWVVIETVNNPKKDAYDTVEFAPVITTGLRIDVQLQENVSGGILEWKFQ